MNLDAVRRKAEEIALTTLAALVPSVKMRTENVNFSPPSGVHWVDFKVSPGKDSASSLGSDVLHHGFGVLNFTVLAPENSGTKRLLEIATALGNAFRNKRFSLGADGYLTFMCVTTRNRGTMNGYLAYGVMVEYRHAVTTSN